MVFSIAHLNLWGSYDRSSYQHHQLLSIAHLNLWGSYDTPPFLIFARSYIKPAFQRVFQI